MEIDKIGNIEVINIREVFKKEDKDFTPWLKDNLDLLGDKLGLEIIDGTIEESVGGFRCDIHAKEQGTNGTVIIENQFGTTDHDHLGKVFTYAAGLNANIIIWIAEKLREEHEEVLNWLNDNIDPESNISFFGIEVKMIKIGNSLPAPDFRIIVKPNDWGRNIRTTTRSIGNAKLFLEIFTEIIDEFSRLNPDWNPVKPQPYHYVGFTAGKSGILFMWTFRGSNRFSIELYIDRGKDSQEINKQIFDELQKSEQILNQHYPDLSWERLDSKRASRIILYHPLPGKLENLDEKDKENLVLWASSEMTEFRKRFKEIIENLTLI